MRIIRCKNTPNQTAASEELGIPRTIVAVVPAETVAIAFVLPLVHNTA
jgi:hypothetical protein